MTGILITASAFGVIDTQIESEGGVGYLLLGLADFVVSLAFVFVWLDADRPSVAYRRSRATNIGIVAMPAVFVAVYLYRSRAPGERFRAIGFFLAFLFLTFLAYVLGVVGAGIAHYALLSTS